MPTIDSVTKKWVKNASDERAVRNGCRFDEERATFACEWIEENCVLYEGEMAGQPMRLCDWQLDATMRLFGWVRFSEEWGREVRRFRRAGIWIPKKNAKTPQLSAWGLHLFVGDGEQGQKVYTTARDGKQAMIAHQHAIEMVKRSPALMEECTINKSTGQITHLPTSSIYKVVAGDNTKSQEGLNGSILVDECFVAGTKILTPSGETSIERLRPGDPVFCATGLGVVKSTFSRHCDDLYLVEFSDGTRIQCTGSHPVFTDRGWVAASALDDRAFAYGPQAVRRLWEGVWTLAEAEGERQGGRHDGAEVEYAEMLLHRLLEEAEEPNALLGYYFQGPLSAAGNASQAYPARRQRAITALAAVGTAPRPGGWLGAGTGRPDWNAPGERLPDGVQTRHRQFGLEDRDRGRWPVSLRDRAEGAGPEEGGVSDRARVVRVSRLKRNSPAPVFNLHVRGHPSYFANGKLVHNCHVVDRALMKILRGAGISRSEPLHIEVSTAGNNPDGYGKEMWDKGRRVEKAEPGFEDDSFLFIGYAAPQELSDEDLEEDPVKWGKIANPAWGRLIKPSEYLSDYRDARNSLSALLDFKMYRLNIWQRSSNPWLRAGDWEKCRSAFTEDDLRGRECWAGLDLSRTRDMSALVLTFPGDEDEEFFQLPYFWLPEKRADEIKEVAPFHEWARKGFLTLTPGSVIDYGFIKGQFRKLAQKFKIQELIYDPRFAEEPTQVLEQGSSDDSGKMIEEGTGIPRFAFAQNDNNFAAPTADYERLVIAGKLKHNGHPVLTWQAGHVEVVQGFNRVKRVVKPKRDDPKTVDGIVAGVMSLAGAMLHPKSQYRIGMI